MFKRSDSIIPLDLTSVDTPRGRFYTTPTGNKYPSVTTVLGAKEKQGLLDWRNSLGPVKADRETKRSSDRGTAVHLMVERFLNNESDPTKHQRIEHIVEFNSLKLLLKNINNIMLQESALYSDDFRIAGRVDCVGEYQGKLSVIDFKTSTNSKPQQAVTDYFLQTTAYAIMVEELYDIVIDDLVIIMSVEKGVPLVFKGKVDDYIAPLAHRINNYYISIMEGKNG